MKTFSLRLVWIIENFYEDQKDFITKTGVNQGTISQLTRGKISLPSMDIALKMSEQGFDLNWLLTGQGTIFANSQEGRKKFEKFEAEYKCMQELYKLASEPSYSYQPKIDVENSSYVKDLS